MGEAIRLCPLRSQAPADVAPRAQRCARRSPGKWALGRRVRARAPGPGSPSAPLAALGPARRPAARRPEPPARAPPSALGRCSPRRAPRSVCAPLRAPLPPPALDLRGGCGRGVGRGRGEQGRAANRRRPPPANGRGRGQRRPRSPPRSRRPAATAERGAQPATPGDAGCVPRLPRHLGKVPLASPATHSRGVGHPIRPPPGRSIVLLVRGPHSFTKTDTQDVRHAGGGCACEWAQGPRGS